MARKQENFKYPTEDGEVEITLLSMGGLDASKLGLKLGGMLGPAIISIFVAADSKDSSAGAEAGRMLAEKLTPATFESVLKEVLAGAQMKIGEEFEDVTMALLNDTFSGSAGSIYKLAYDAVRLNFRNFSRGLGISSESIAKLEAIAKKQAAKVGAA